MANGDIATTLGWAVNAGTDDRRNGWDRINYVLDRAAEQRITLRDTVLPAVNQPVFKAGRSTTRLPIANQTWTPLAGNAYALPVLNDGFTSWTAGQLTIKKAGVYRLSIHAGASVPQDNIAMQVVRNTQTPDTINTLVKNDSAGSGVSSTDLVRLVAGDVLVALIYMRGQMDHLLNTNSYDLSLALEWVRA